MVKQLFMTVQAVEKKFQEFKASLSADEFNSVEHLTAKAQQLEASDPELSQRILVRVANLRKQEADKLKRAEKDEVTKAAFVKTKNDSGSKKLPLMVKRLIEWVRLKPVVALVVLPTLLFAFYQNFWASERFVSSAKVIVQQPDGMATMDTSMALLTGLGVPSTGIADTELVKAYILSNDMLKYLDKTLNLKQHYGQSGIDFFSRNPLSDSWESFHEYYLRRVNVSIDAKSNIVNVDSQAFEPEFAHKLTQTIVERAEWYINSIGHQLANEQLNFMKEEHLNIENKLESAQTKLLNFQQRYDLLDPTAEGLAMQQITYGLEGQISAKEAELKGLLGIMNPNAPQVISAQNQLSALQEQLEKERGKLSNSAENIIPVSEILSQFTDLKVKMELALQAYTSSQISLEKSRIEAYRQLKYLIVVESATEPHEAKYPEVFYNISLFFLIALMLFATGKIVIATIRELS